MSMSIQHIEGDKYRFVNEAGEVSTVQFKRDKDFISNGKMKYIGDTDYNGSLTFGNDYQGG